MKNRSGEKIKLTSIDELLGVVNEESAMEIEISKIYAFKDHPFKVLDDEKMADLIESVKINGVLTPVLIRSDDEEGYEMISGHRRLHRSRVWGKRNPHQENSEVERGAKWHNVKHEWILLLKDLPSHITKGLGKKIQGEIEKN